jgi:hypothetical protein
LHSPGLMIPGQLGPISREAVWLINAFFTLTMSCCGTPSVMHTWWQQGAQRLLRGRSDGSGGAATAQGAQRSEG